MVSVEVHDMGKKGKSTGRTVVPLQNAALRCFGKQGVGILDRFLHFKNCMKFF